MQKLIRKIKNSIVKDEVKYREILLGLCSGYYFPINFRNSMGMYLGLYEYEIAKYMEKYVTKNACCYDVGSARGYYICAFHKHSQSGPIYAFEPDPKWEQIVLKVLKFNNINNVRYFQKSLGRKTSNDKKVITIDYLVFKEKLVPPDVIKVDIDGPEYDLLCGAEKTINKFSPKFIIETHSKEAEEKCRNFLEERGYRTTTVKNRRFLKEHRPIAHNRWLCARCF